MSDPLPVPNVLRFSGDSNSGRIYYWAQSDMSSMWYAFGGISDCSDPGGRVEMSSETNKSLTTMQRAYGKALICKIKENNHGNLARSLGKSKSAV